MNETLPQMHLSVPEAEWRQIKTQVALTHDAVTTMLAEFKAGPGSWPSCVLHKSLVEDHETRLRSLEVRMWKAVGGCGVLFLISTVISIYSLLHKL